MKAKLHVIFSPSAAGTLRQALLSADRLDEVLCPFDDFSVGPIATDGADTRARWVEETLEFTGWHDVTEQSATFLAAFDAPAISTTAWISRCETRSYAGFLWWLSHIGDMPISIIEVTGLSTMNAERMIELLDRAAPFPSERRRVDQARWAKLMVENAPLRVIDEKDLVSVNLEYFDDILLTHVSVEWQKMARIVASVLVDFSDANVYQAGDLVLSARLADLAEAGRLEWRGDLSQMQGCEFRLPTT